MVWVSNDRFILPRSSFYVPVKPPGIDPDKETLVQVCFNEKWLPYILGALEQLINPATWDATTPTDLATVEGQANTLLWMFQSAVRCQKTVVTSAGAETGHDQMIRQNPDNPCLLETSIDGTNWCAFADLSKCANFGTQPGGGSTQPQPGGGSACYQAFLSASEKWLLPTAVNTGDVITCSGFSGAGSDGTVSWYCPNGSGFFLGTCGTIFSTDSGDPNPAVSHMAIIAEINGVYYDATAGAITVPSGVTNQQVTFQVNDQTLGDNSGSYQFQVCVENNAAKTFTHTFDFVVSANGWTGFGDSAVYTPGTGWVVTVNPSGGSGQSGIQVDDTAYTLTSILMTYTQTGSPGFSYLRGGAGSTILKNPALTGSPSYWSGSQASTTEVNFTMGRSGVVTISQIIVTGIGNDPY